MRSNEKLSNGCIGDHDVRYDAEMEGYTTSMSYMSELSEMAIIID